MMGWARVMNPFFLFLFFFWRKLYLISLFFVHYGVIRLDTSGDTTFLINLDCLMVCWYCLAHWWHSYNYFIIIIDEQDVHFFYKQRVNWVEAQYTQEFSNLSLKLCLMVCLISKDFSWSDIVFDMNTAMVSFKCSNLNVQLSLAWTLQWSL